MSTEVILYVLTGLGTLVVLLTRLRLSRGQGAGRHQIGQSLLAVHTVAGVLAVAGWLTFLLAPEESAAGDSLVGVAALGCWWVVSLIGLLILTRWLPSRGRHAGGGPEDSWSSGPWLSILAHLGMFAGVCFFTWAYVTSMV